MRSFSIVTYHVQAEQGPHVSVVQFECLRKIFSGQLQVIYPAHGVFDLETNNKTELRIWLWYST